ncbi:hypothetical protein LDENG_00213800 [Lucifuga dentata]|nr:hypothetical protein LDENG_00213800 [Lucifuga dentata]
MMSELLNVIFVAASMFLSLTSALTTLNLSDLSCVQQGLSCTVSSSNCMDSGWLVPRPYTPNGPNSLQAEVVTRRDEDGRLQPVLLARWTLKDDGSIHFLKATELHVLAASTNQNLCVQYSFSKKLQMRKWSFSADMVVVEPGQIYRVSVFNIPKPQPDQTSYDVSTEVRVPDCRDSRMQMSNFCIERGSFWQPNISLTHSSSALTVSFNTDRLCDKYIVMVCCSTIQHAQSVTHLHQDNHTSLNVTFDAEKWPRSCCRFVVDINPLFPHCGQDCVRRRRTVDVCPAVVPEKLTEVPARVAISTFVAVGVAVLCVAMAFILYVFCRSTPDRPDGTLPPSGAENQKQHLPEHPPKVLVIYSHDHRLYKDVVLKLCAFLQAKCGVQVLVDLLDSTLVGIMGRLRWLEWQRQQLNNPSDKILVLCSRGVQVKWRSICGQDKRLLREDVLSPTDDMLIPFLNLFLPDMHQAGMLGKYMVAYFNDISSEQDVPSVFDIAVKYKLMKHFEELYFRILDIEKYQPGQVSHIEGIGGDEYFNCPSGKALRNAIEAFQAYQLENPDWFEMECVNSEEEVVAEVSLGDELQISPVMECVPQTRDGPPIYIHEVEISENADSVCILTPEVNPQSDLTSVTEISPAVNHDCRCLYPLLVEVLSDHRNPYRPGTEAFCMTPLVQQKSLPPTQNWLLLEEEPIGPVPTEDEEEDSLLPLIQPSHAALQNSLCSNVPESSEYFSSPEISQQQPVEMEEREVLEHSGKGPSSGSDQGYMSKMSSKPDYPAEEDPLLDLARLQEVLFQKSLMHPQVSPEEN